MSRMRHRRKRGNIFMAAGLLLLAAALFLTFYNIWDGNRADQAAQQVAGELKEQITIESDSDDVSYEYVDGMPVMEVEGNNYIGVLEIPSLDLSLPVMADWDYDKLKIALCRFSGSYDYDDLVIAGHNYTRHFGPLKRIAVEGEVLFIDVRGNVRQYSVVAMETLAPENVEEMASGDYDLTLFTCTMGGGSRYTVRCVRK